MPHASAGSAPRRPPRGEGPGPGGAPHRTAGAPRAWVIYGLGTLLIAFSVYFGAYVYVVVQALIWSQVSLQRGPVVLLFLLVLINLAVRRLLRGRGLSQQELVFLYAMLTIAGCAAGIGFVQFAVNVMAAPRYFATPGNSWRTRLWPDIPPWLAPTNPDAVTAYYRGHSSLYRERWLEAWAVPVLAWGAFLFVAFWVMLCAVALVRRHWVEHERLTFPLVELPLRMTEASGGFWRSRAMWAGFALAGLLESVDFVSFLMPSVPSIPIKPIGPNQLDSYLTTAPWNAAGILRIAFYPWVIGLGFLLSLDVSFSCWFFYLGVKAANVLSFVLGYSQAGGAGAANRAPFIREQSLGAFVGIALLSLWMARRELWRLWSGARRSAEELLPGRVAAIGGLAGAAAMVAFLTAAGVPAHAGLLFVLVYLCIAFTLARIVSEAGSGWAFAPSWSATGFAADVIGPDRLHGRQLVALHGLTGWMGEMRDNPMPQQMQAARLAHSSHAPARALLGPLLWAAGAGILLAFWAHLDIYYRFGAASAKVRSWPTQVGAGNWQQALAVASTPTPRDTAGLLAALVGAAVAASLSWMRLRMAAWPLHPLGYAVATTNSMDYLWFPFLLAWLAKLLVTRYGGIRAYRAGVPFALGLILGDYVVPAAWGLYGMVSGTQQYMVFPH